MTRIQKNLAEIQEEIRNSCNKAGRKPEEITILGVTKNRSVKEIEELIDAGIGNIGENKVQEAERKLPLLQKNCTKHLIGHLQSNKISKALRLFDCIQSIDSLSLAEKLNEKVGSSMSLPFPVFCEVNCSGETQKFGFIPETFEQFYEKLLALEHLSIQGIMTIGPLSGSEREIRNTFKSAYAIRERFVLHTGKKLVLSMGMSSDFHYAILEGSDMVRIGTRFFA